MICIYYPQDTACLVDLQPPEVKNKAQKERDSNEYSVFFYVGKIKMRFLVSTCHRGIQKKGFKEVMAVNLLSEKCKNKATDEHDSVQCIIRAQEGAAD